MYEILRVNTSPSGNILTFIQSCHEYPDVCISMSQISTTSVQVCQLRPNYMREKYAHTTYNIVQCMLYCMRRACIGNFLTNFSQKTPWLPQSPAVLAAL